MEKNPYQKIIDAIIERSLARFRALVSTRKESKYDNTDYYQVLGISKDATQSEIRAAYLRLVKIWHPDKNPDPTARKRFEEIKKAYRILNFNPITNEDSSSMVENLSPQSLRYHPNYNNAVTFLNQTLTEQIPQNKLIVLDGFAFDVDELREYAENDLYQFFKNPHLLERSQGQEFSPNAKYTLKNHPVLNIYAKNLEERLSSQSKNIRPQTVDAVIKMLERFEEKGVEGSEGARAEFLEHKFSLSAEEQKQLDNFIIEIPTEYGTKERFTFEKAFLGGDLVNQCIVAAEIYSWQFVVTLRPSAMSLVPNSVIRAAHSRHFRIGPLGEPNHSSQRERETKTQESSSDLDDDFMFQVLIRTLQSMPRGFAMGASFIEVEDLMAAATRAANLSTFFAVYHYLLTIPERSTRQQPILTGAFSGVGFSTSGLFGSVNLPNNIVEQKATQIADNSFSPQSSNVSQPQSAVTQNTHASNTGTSPLTISRANDLVRQLAETIEDELNNQSSRQNRKLG